VGGSVPGASGSVEVWAAAGSVNKRLGARFGRAGAREGARFGTLPLGARFGVPNRGGDASATLVGTSYSFIHNVKRNRLNAGRAESFVYVLYNLRLFSHYCEEAKEDKNLKHWDNHPEEDNLEDGVMLLEQLENALFDDDDHVRCHPQLLPSPWSPCLGLQQQGSSSSSIHSIQFRPSQAPPLPPRGGTRGNRVGGRRMG
jgi:hypothetical protein